MKTISSPVNPNIKNLVKLKKNKNRDEQNLVLVEGEKEIEIAVLSGRKILELYILEDKSQIKIAADKTFLVSQAVAAKLSNRENPASCFALIEKPDNDLAAIKLSARPLVLVLEGLEKPGNIGAALRTADAIKADALLVANPHTDFFNPSVIRTSRGTVFSVPIAAADNEEIFNWLKKNKIQIISTSPSSGLKYTDCDFKPATAILVGAEHEGLSSFWLNKADKSVRIPMQGKIDSLNASVGLAVVAFETVRQRG